MPKKHTAQAGESVESIAFDNGFFWETVWNHGGNSALRTAREPNILEEGDVVEVPDKRPKTLSEPVDQRYRYRRKGVPSVLRVRLLDQNKPRPNVSYTVRVGEKVISGKTDADGWVQCYLMPDVETGVLRLPETDETYNFRIGTVRPIVSVKGLQNRLHNLGYFQGAQDGVQTPELEEALRAFQLARRLPETGKIDAATVQALKDFHGS